MRARVENGCTIISDVYEPLPSVPRRPYPHALLVLVMVSVAVGILFILAAI